MPTLQDADELRATDRVRALSLYAELRDALRPDDEERILWICEQVAPTPPPALAAVLERVPETASREVRRAALHARATIARFHGDGPESERLLRTGLRFPGATRDRTWIRTALNLAGHMHGRGCIYEPLVLAGMGRRAATAAGIPYLAAFAGLLRVEVLLDMGDQRRATEALAEAAEAAQRVTAHGESRVVEYEHRCAIARLCEETGDRERARAEWADLLSWLEAYGAVEDAIFVEVHAARLRLRFELEPERRSEILAEFGELTARYSPGRSLARRVARDDVELRLRAAADDGRRDEAHQLARDLLALLDDPARNAQQARRAVRLARVLTAALDAPELAGGAYEVASTCMLLRLVEAERSAREIPELAEAGPDDLEALRDYRERLGEDQSDLLRAVAAALRPGEAAFDVLVQDAVVRLCAWCSRTHTREGGWLPLTHFLPASDEFRVSHGLCPDCGARFFPESA